MTHKILLLFCATLLTISCKNRVPENKEGDDTNGSSQELTQKNIDTVLVDEFEDIAHTDPNALAFKHVFNFSYKNKLATGRVSILHDSINELVLYEPEDEMTDFVIIKKDGTVYSFYTGEHDNKVVYKSTLTFTPDSPSKTYPLNKKLVPVSKTDTSYQLDLSDFNMPVYSFEGYKATYALSNTSIDFYITDQIAVNSEQLHAFGQILDVDWNYPIAGAHLPGIISSKQIIGKLTDAYGGETVLTSYSPTAYWAQIADYRFIINEGSDDWEEKPLPLLRYTTPE